MPPTYTKKTCETCLAKAAEAERALRQKAAEAVPQSADEKICSVCTRSLPLEEFVGTGFPGQQTKTCLRCREANRRADEKRDMEHIREIARKNSAKPEKKAVKAEWRENNADKCLEYDRKHKHKQILELGIEEYNRRNAETAKIWRENNPEKYTQSLENRRTQHNQQYAVYRLSARSKNLDFEISEEEYYNLTSQPCIYCGDPGEHGFVGIDRADSFKGYILPNCVPCCSMCNYLKKSLSPAALRQRVEHILTHLGHVDGRLWPEAFPHTQHVALSQYSARANKKNIPFHIHSGQFRDLIKQDCYICGKSAIAGVHQTGIDRFDNTLGYITENVRPCCRECNYMKNDYSYDAFIAKLKQVYERTKDESREPEPEYCNRSMIAGNRESREKREADSAARKRAKQEKQLAAASATFASK